MKNIPKKIYLQVGDNSGNDFGKLHGVSWCEDRINDSDIEYELSLGIIGRVAFFSLGVIAVVSGYLLCLFFG